MKQSPLPYEQLRLPEVGPEDAVVPEARLSEAQEARIDRLMDQAGKNYEDARIIVLGGESAVARTAAVEPVEPVTPVRKPVPLGKTHRRRGARAQAWGETTPAEGGWSDVA